ncbi:TPA: hypothetical protein L9G89_005361 [Klebsiella pneumoniae]|uniref:hypothetical protein n=1 Tax=Klebsiella pneumoniae TaxID=573 RepID=UPI000E2BC508|nr:hypothetical protein [Klebsiella pneumoniae]HDS7789514.1 hypothetical protein [Klebsiella pneumoniae subsp. ozaenae]HDU3807839.1 hypothetical protein [Klebsiella pneumoniae subsp. pneumoniae]MCP6497064.1 hypothetical protein [Klebsiella pneumoniae]QLT31634.1 hypothetical protein HV294_26735 [Klebsiella pneumoniae]SWE74499.1 Uncharacterised protein [Klebsiella pneumoniae]
MERQQEIEERSRDLIRKVDEKERQELKRFDLLYGIFWVLLFFCFSWMFFFVQYEDFRDMQPATPEQLQSIIHDAPCAGEAFRMALQTNNVTSSATLTFGDAKKMASECKDKKEIKAVREKQLNALNDMSK